MAQVTLELRKLLTVKNFKLFDFDYPIISQDWKNEFEKTFVEVYYDHEIGVETPDKFKQRLKAKLLKIMPRYIDHYQKMQKVIDPFIMEKVEESIKTLESQSGKTSSSSSGDTQVNVTSNTTTTDYPQHTVIESNIPSAMSKDSSQSSGIQSASESSTDSKNKDRDVIRVLTKTGKHLEIVQELLKLQENYTEQILNELKTLFILVY